MNICKWFFETTFVETTANTTENRTSQSTPAMASREPSLPIAEPPPSILIEELAAIDADRIPPISKEVKTGKVEALRDKVLSEKAYNIIELSQVIPDEWEEIPTTLLNTIISENEAALIEAADPEIKDEVNAIKRDIKILTLQLNEELTPNELEQVRQLQPNLKKCLSLLYESPVNEKLAFIQSLTAGGARYNLSGSRINCGSLLIKNASLMLENFLLKDKIGPDTTLQSFIETKLQILRNGIAREIFNVNVKGTDTEIMYPRYLAQCNKLKLGIADEFNYRTRFGDSNLAVINEKKLKQEFNKRYSTQSILGYLQSSFSEVLEIGYGANSHCNKENIRNLADQYKAFAQRKLFCGIEQEIDNEEDIIAILGADPLIEMAETGYRAPMWVISDLIKSSGNIKDPTSVTPLRWELSKLSPSSLLSIINSPDFIDVIKAETVLLSIDKERYKELFLIPSLLDSLKQPHYFNCLTKEPFIAFLTSLVTITDNEDLNSCKEMLFAKVLEVIFKFGNQNEINSAIDNEMINSRINPALINAALENPDFKDCTNLLRLEKFQSFLLSRTDLEKQRLIEKFQNKSLNSRQELIKQETIKEFIQNLERQFRTSRNENIHEDIHRVLTSILPTPGESTLIFEGNEWFKTIFQSHFDPPSGVEEIPAHILQALLFMNLMSQTEQ